MRLLISCVGLSFVFLGAMFCHAQVPIEGHVFDLNGHPVPQATVKIFPLDVPVRGPLPMALSDKDGFFQLVSPPYGKVWMIPYKVADGFPDTQGLVFATGHEKFVELTLSQGTSFHDVDIRFGRPHGIISGTVRDANTGQPVDQARITLRRSNSPDIMYSAYIQSEGTFLFALPEREITITVSAPGYRPWTYHNSRSGNNYVLLAQHAREQVDVRLEQEKKK